MSRNRTSVRFTAIHANDGANAENSVPGGWTKEFSSAKASAAKEQTSLANLRCARAASKLRLYESVAKYCKLGLSLSPTSEEKTQLTRLSREAKEFLRKAEAIGLKEFKKSLVNSIFKQKIDIDFTMPLGPYIFSNLNLMQNSVLSGDIDFLELAVGFGSALDYKVKPGTPGQAGPGGLPMIAPEGVTVLALACAFLASMNMSSQAVMFFRAGKSMEEITECCILLVMLGADCSARYEFTMPENACALGGEGFILMSQGLGLTGKTAKELAVMSGQQKLVRAMEKVSTKEKALENVYCRCGSRLSWKECHAGQKFVSYCAETQDTSSQLLWRFSPFAKCLCFKSNKSYYKCCWNSTQEYFHNDHTAGLVIRSSLMQRELSDDVMELFNTYLKFRKLEIGDNEDALLFPARDDQGRPIEGQPKDRETSRREAVENIRRFGVEIDNSPYVTKSPLWDRNVVAGIVQNIDNYFVWFELHWKLPKSELLLRTREWNEALEAYCNQAGLHGQEREKVIELHKADPRAPCGNSACSNREHKVKGFKACSRCKSIAYCSKDCQRTHWKQAHKKKCFPSSLV